jgi:hypothetical protein
MNGACVTTALGGGAGAGPTVLCDVISGVAEFKVSAFQW